MTTNSASLLSLDTFASEESLRVASYARALQFTNTSAGEAKPAEVAEMFFDFIGNDRWRLDALDVALRYASRRDDAVRLITRAEEIVDFVKHPPEPKAPEKPASKAKVISKKSGGRKK